MLSRKWVIFFYFVLCELFYFNYFLPAIIQIDSYLKVHYLYSDVAWCVACVCVAVVLSSDEGEPCEASRCPSSPDNTLVSVETAETEEEPSSTQEEKPEEAPGTCRDMQVWQNILGANERAKIVGISTWKHPNLKLQRLFVRLYWHLPLDGTNVKKIKIKIFFLHLSVF